MMKKITFFIVLSFAAGLIQAQIPNGSFEDSVYAQYPKNLINWSTPNVFFTDLSDPANSYVELYNNNDGSNPVNLISDTHTLDFSKAKGFAINGRPDSLIVWLTYQIPSADTLIIRTKNRETQNPFGYGELRLTGSQNEMTRYAVKINYTSPGFADSGVIQAYVTNHSSDWHTVSVESMRFINFIGNPLNVVPNYQFNDWQMDSLKLPQDWVGLSYVAVNDGSVPNRDYEQFTSDASDGNSAIKLTTHVVDGDAYSGILAAVGYQRFAAGYNGDIEAPLPMFSVLKRNESLLGDYKFTTLSIDTAEISCAMFYQGKIVAKKNLYLTETTGSAYQNFEIHLDYDTFTGIPDSSSIFIFSSKGDNGKQGTQLYIDNLRFAETSSTNRILPSEVVVYPNPSSNVLHIETGNCSIEGIRLMNTQGKIIKQYQINSINDTELNMSKVPSGTYILGIRIEGIMYHHKITIQK